MTTGGRRHRPAGHAPGADPPCGGDSGKTTGGRAA